MQAPYFRSAAAVVVAVKLVSDIVKAPIHLRVVIPPEINTYEGVLAAVDTAFEATRPEWKILVRVLARRAWVVDVRPLEGQGVMARIYDDADVRRMMDVGRECVCRMIIGCEG